MATKKKHVSFPQQREQCRLNKFTYIEKVGSLKEPLLFCNYPFPEPAHKKGICKASLCTDMREIPDDILAADDKETEAVAHKGEAGDNLTDEAMNKCDNNDVEGLKGMEDVGDTTLDDETQTFDDETQTFDDGAEAVTKEMGADGPEGLMAEVPVKVDQ